MNSKILKDLVTVDFTNNEKFKLNNPDWSDCFSNSIKWSTIVIVSDRCEIGDKGDKVGLCIVDQPTFEKLKPVILSISGAIADKKRDQLPGLAYVFAQKVDGILKHGTFG